jgi:hypothetical protein
MKRWLLAAMMLLACNDSLANPAPVAKVHGCYGLEASSFAIRSQGRDWFLWEPGSAVDICVDSVSNRFTGIGRMIVYFDSAGVTYGHCLMCDISLGYPIPVPLRGSVSFRDVMTLIPDTTYDPNTVSVAWLFDQQWTVTDNGFATLFDTPRDKIRMVFRR